MNLRFKAAIAAVVVVIVATGGFAVHRLAFGAKTDGADDPAQQDEALAAAFDESIYVKATGNVSARADIPLHLSHTQTVLDVYVKEGDPVRAGDVLITYDIERDTSKLEREREQAEIKLLNARLELRMISQSAPNGALSKFEKDTSEALDKITNTENAIKDIELSLIKKQNEFDEAYVKMYDSDDSQEDYADLEKAYLLASEGMEKLFEELGEHESNLELYKSQLSEAERILAEEQEKLAERTDPLKYEQQKNICAIYELELARINEDIALLTKETKSPVTGYAASVNAVRGGEVPKGSAIAVVADTTQLIVAADIPELDALRLKLGQTASVSINGLDRLCTGEITRINEAAVGKEKSSGMEMVVPIEITLQNPDDMLKAGYTVNIEINAPDVLRRQ